jgi:hypothetical protein
MPIGRKTGGRQKGTPNKTTQDVVARLKELGCDPIEGMAMLALDPGNPPELRGRMFSELAQYVAPKRKAVEHSAEPGTIAGFVVYGVPEAEDMGQWKQTHRPAG